MNSVRAIMGATQVGGRGRRVYGGKEAFYGFDCRCSDGEMVGRFQDKVNNVQSLLPLNKYKNINIWSDAALNNEFKMLNNKLKNGKTRLSDKEKEDLAIEMGMVRKALRKRGKPVPVEPNGIASTSIPSSIPPQLSPQNKISPTRKNKYDLMDEAQLRQELSKQDKILQTVNLGAPARTEARGRSAALKKRLEALGVTVGGARRRKARKATSSRKANAEKYKKFLDGLDVKRLQKIAKTKGIKITKKKDGKTVYCKKATIVSKLFKFKYGK